VDDAGLLAIAFCVWGRAEERTRIGDVPTAEADDSRFAPLISD
jgi:hypothetical protein